MKWFVVFAALVAVVLAADKETSVVRSESIWSVSMDTSLSKFEIVWLESCKMELY